MSYYGHPFCIVPGQPQAQFQRQAPNQQFSLADLADEERTALAYLRSVQRRREAAEAAAALESRQRAAAAARHEEAVRAAAKQQAAAIAAARREKAIRETLERERARETRLAAALEQRRREAIAEAIESERARQAKAAHAYQAALAQHRQRAQQQMEHRQRHAQLPSRVNAAGASQVSTPPTARAAPAVAAPVSAPKKTNDEDDEEIDFDGINQLLGSLFGFNVAKEDIAALRADQEANVPATSSAPAKADKVTDKVTDSTKAVEQLAKDVSQIEDTKEVEKLAKDAKQVEDTKAVENLAKDVGKIEGSKKAAPADDTADLADAPLNPNAQPFVPSHQADTPAENELPPELNQLLNQFLGLQVDPAATGETGSGAGKVVGDAVVNLNDILSRYGLEFVPDEEDDSEEDKSASKRSEPAAEHAPEFVALKELPKPKAPAADSAATDSAPAKSAPTDSAPAAPKKPEAKKAPVVRAEPHPEPTSTPATKEPKVSKPAPTSAPVTADHTPEFISAAPAKTDKTDKNGKADKNGKTDKTDKTTPFTSTLDHHSKIPTHLRDILANVEDAMNALSENEEEAPPHSHKDADCSCDADTQAKCNSGQPCAKSGAKKRNAKKKQQRRQQRERKAHAPKPAEAEPEPEMTPERVEAFGKLDKIQNDLKELTKNFTFPPHLGFGPSTPDGSQPPLLFNRHNTPYHAQAHALLQLILACDGIISDGDRVIRRRRKDLVGEIEGALAALEARRDARWEEVRARRERGESDDEDDETSSTELTDSETEGYEVI